MEVHNTVCIFLDQHHARLECVDCNQQTPLHRAAAHNQSDAIVTLLAAGAKINKRDS